ncbi:hypothetical protein ACSFXN_07215 [Planococcus sp. 1R117A]|uniref:hypothetical protein n=1 Tax=Planococcus sp. 1R117A TaxID=3447020 RepID=UPI003EDB9298
MSKQSLRVAIEKGKKLRKCESLKEAESYFLNFKDTVLGQFDLVAGESRFFTTDYKVESLKALEKWYFHLIESDEFEQLGMNRMTLKQYWRCTLEKWWYGIMRMRNGKWRNTRLTQEDTLLAYAKDLSVWLLAIVLETTILNPRTREKTCCTEGIIIPSRIKLSVRSVRG